MHQTPLNQKHLNLGAKLVPFGGWEMPVQYEGILAEHMATRTKVAIFDICHMGEFIVEGPAASQFVDLVVSSKAGTQKVGKCKYGFLLSEEAKILDDLITYRLDDNKFMMVVNAATTSSDYSWLEQNLIPNVTLSDISKETAKLDVQGPESQSLLQNVFNINLNDLGYFSWLYINFKNTQILLSRTGYTGELGYELYFDVKIVEELWDLIIASGATPAGLGARDTLRLEAALPLYGQEVDNTLTPKEANLMRFVSKKKEYIGSNILLEMGEVPFTLVGFATDVKRAARHDHQVLINGEIVGRVTSGSIAPSLGYSIGFAYVKTPFAKPGQEIEINLGKKILAAKIVELPFLKK